ncbi:MAG TPA: DUF1501 domain-containing protein [Verrucomicrobiae bacterium]|nr:DUF1501 domain-containing protein [Verrucomicrobiae bacterium]
MANVITRRSFMKASVQASIATGLASMVNIPHFLQRALAEGSIGLSGKKLLFLFFRGGNDGLNNLIPINDPGYAFYRPTIGLPKDPAVDYGAITGQADVPGMIQPYAIRLGNGFAALNPNLYDLAPLFNTGHLALLHRVAYRSQSRSHFDSEKYWEKATDGVTANNRTINDGVFYRTIVESGWNRTHALAAVSIQSNMPQSLRGVEPMTNLSSINRYNLLGVSGATTTANNVTVAADRLKLLNAIDAANARAYPSKENREMILGLGQAFRDTFDIFQDPAYGFARNDFVDEDGKHLFPTNTGTDEKGLGAGAYGFFTNLKSAAQVLANTDAIIAGTEFGGFDTHTAQVTVGSPHLGGHASLLRRIGWAFSSLAKFFSNPAYSPKVRWEDVVVLTLSEFGRTSAENASVGTDHAEASVMYVAGGGIHGGVYGCDTDVNPAISLPNWTPCTAIAGGTTPTVAKDGSMFAANNNVGYLRRTIDYRSVLGEIIRDHLGATQAQLERIIAAYARESTEHLKNGGMVATTPIVGELGLI